VCQARLPLINLINLVTLAVRRPKACVIFIYDELFGRIEVFWLESAPTFLDIEHARLNFAASTSTEQITEKTNQLQTQYASLSRDRFPKQLISERLPLVKDRMTDDDLLMSHAEQNRNQTLTSNIRF
jgi:hypothetical protein